MKVPLVLAAAALLLGPASAARADIALLTNGTTLKVTAQRRDGATVVLVLKGGGEVGVAAAELRGIVPDEVLEEVEAPASAGNDLAALIVAAARRHHLDPELVRAVVSVESGFRPDAVSPKGAQGLMQLMPATARSLGVKDPFDPADNVDGGVRYLRALIDRYDGDVKRALAAYNAGMGAVARHGGIPPYPETLVYVSKVLQRAQADAGSSR
ncbi:MAG TPA: lytic transglycosylase domain-containing protein [Vicinamibacteria bacterium]|nr:lytic transglycosylase domain-containing protein [Vicinamibacteria bacterium]